MRGRIKQFFIDRGFGFITGEDSEDYFFHISQVKDMVELKKWMIVEFDVTEGKKGKNAVNIRVPQSINVSKFINCGNINIRLNNIKEYGISKYPALYEKVFQEYQIPNKRDGFWELLFEKKKYLFENEWYCHGEILMEDIEYFINNDNGENAFYGKDRVEIYLIDTGTYLDVRKHEMPALIREAGTKRLIRSEGFWAYYKERKDIFKIEYMPYLYIETYQKENFQFKKGKVNFNVYEKYNEIHNAMMMKI